MSQTQEVVDATAVVDAYLDAWNETDAAKRATKIERAWIQDASYADPLLEGNGRPGIDRMIAGVQQQYPGNLFRRTSGVDQHHDQVRFGWELFAPDGSVVVAGIDVATIAADGKLARVVGFFGDLPQKP